MDPSNATPQRDGKTTDPTAAEDYGKAIKFDESDYAGCLALLGTIVFIPLLMAALEDSAGPLHQPTGPSPFVENVWRWIHGEEEHRWCAPRSFLLLGLPILIWQSFVFALGRRTVIPPSRLWAASSVYFAVAILVVVGAYGGAELSWPARLVKIMGWSIIPGTFLSLTLSLWARTPLESPGEPGPAGHGADPNGQ